MNWQPIETAPKDASMFLVYVPGLKQPMQTAWQNRNGVRVIGAAFAFDLPPATHWMPLPPPPTTPEDAD